jgi:hypothetical protein
MKDENQMPEPGVAVVGRRVAGHDEVPGDVPGDEPAEDHTGARTGARVATARRARPAAVVGSLRRRLGTGGAEVRPSTVGGPASRRRAPAWLVPLLLIVSALSLLSAIGFALAWNNLQSQADAKTTVTRVAKDFLISLTNFTPKNLDARLSNLSSYATGDFAKQENQFFGTSIRQALEKVQASSQGQVRYIFVQSLNGSQATVYAWVDQTFVNDKLTSPQTDVLQVSLTMLQRPAGWKIGNVTVLNAPNPTSGSLGGG